LRDTFRCGNEQANIGNLVITMGGCQITAEIVITDKGQRRGQAS
jgi:steroid Delta-isomerase